MNEAVASDAVEFVRNMKIGRNLGNTFDAYSDRNQEDEPRAGGRRLCNR